MAYFIHREEDYAIRLVVYLAGQSGMVKMEDICKNLHLSKPTVAKLVSRLKTKGFVTTKTGKNGGLTPGENLKDKSLLDVLECMGFDRTFNACLEHPGYCELQPQCNITSYMAEIHSNIIKMLDKAKVGDFLFSKSLPVQHLI